MRASTISIVHEDSREAGRDAIDELLAECGGAPDLALVFSSSKLDSAEVLAGIWAGLEPGTRVLGCSSYAEIGAESGLTGSVTIMGITFGDVEWELFKLDTIGDAVRPAGRSLGEQIRPFEPKLVVVLPDGLVGNTMKFVNGIQDVLGPGCPIVGGLASEHFEFEHTYQFFDRERLSGGAVVLALRGPIRVATAAGAGFQPVGLTRTCTHVVDDKYIHTLDGESAVELYKAFFGADALESPTVGIEFPLAVVSGASGDYMESNERTMIIRAVRSFDAASGVIECGGEIYQGAQVRMTRASKADLVAAATAAVDRALAEIPNPALCFVFNCAGRKLVLGARYQGELDAAFAALGEVPCVGFYTYGEIAPIDGRNMVHDETFTLAIVGASA